jgi:hypothetical protein
MYSGAPDPDIRYRHLERTLNEFSERKRRGTELMDDGFPYPDSLETLLQMYRRQYAENDFQLHAQTKIWMGFHPQSPAYQYAWQSRERWDALSLSARDLFYQGRLQAWYFDQSGEIKGIPPQICATDEWKFETFERQVPEGLQRHSNGAPWLVLEKQLKNLITQEKRKASGKGKQTSFAGRIDSDDALLEAMHGHHLAGMSLKAAARIVSVDAVMRDGGPPRSEKQLNSVVRRLLRKYQKEHGDYKE